jgi:hypothetical protein
MESAALRASHRLGPGQKGVLIRNVAPTSPAAGVLAAGDIVMRFDGMQVACDGTVPFRCGPTLLRTTALSHALGPRLSAGAAARRTGERISFHYLISQKYTGDQAGCPTLNLTLPLSSACRSRDEHTARVGGTARRARAGAQVRLDVLRDGRTLELDVRLASPDALVPLHLGGQGPSFLIIAGAAAPRARPPRRLSRPASVTATDAMDDGSSHPIACTRIALMSAHQAGAPHSRSLCPRCTVRRMSIWRLLVCRMVSRRAGRNADPVPWAVW